MRTMCLIVVFLSCLLSFGCSSSQTVAEPQFDQVPVGMPWEMTTITVVNNTNGLIDLVHDGDVVMQNLAPGGPHKVVLRNTSGMATTTVVAIGRTTKGNPNGAAYRTFWHGPNYDTLSKKSEVWLIQAWDLRK